MLVNHRLSLPTSAADWDGRKQGYRWANIVERVSTLSLNSAEVVAFRLTIDRLRRDLGIGRGHCSDVVCPHCVSEVLDAYPGGEDELVTRYHRNLNEVQHALDALVVA